MPVVIVCEGLTGPVTAQPGAIAPHGAFLKKYDPEAHNGRGDADWTYDRRSALRFADFKAAMEVIRAVPRAMPRRWDGQPNRPLTAFHLTVAPAPEQEG